MLNLLTALILANSPGTPTILYVLTTGHDTNNCASVPNACATIQTALNKLPKVITGPTIIEVGPGHYSWGAYVDGFSFDSSGWPGWNTDAGYIATQDAGPYLSIQGTMNQASLGGLMTGTVYSATDGVGPGTGSNSGPANWSTVLIADAGWTANALAGYPICMITGNDTPDCSLVYQNTWDVATITGTWKFTTPSNGDHFQVQTWATEIDGGLPRPPGGAGLKSFSGNFPAAFFVQGNQAPGWRSGFGVGFGNDITGWPGATGTFGTQSIFGNTALTEPMISISNFRFDNGDYMVDVGETGSDQLINFSMNNVQAGIGVYAVGGASYYAISNYSSQDSFGDFVYWIGDYMAGVISGSGGYVGALTKATGFTFLYGNYATQVYSDDYTTILDCSGNCLVVDNAFVEFDGPYGFGVNSYGVGSVISSIGNEYYQLQDAITTGEVLHATIYSDSDDFSLDRTIFYGIQQSNMILGGYAPTSTSYYGYILQSGSILRIPNDISVAGIGDGGDFFIDDISGSSVGLYSYDYLINDGGLFNSVLGASPQLIQYSPSAIVELNTGTAIYKDTNFE